MSGIARHAALARLLVLVVATFAAAPAGAQGPLFRDGFESGTPWHWSVLPGGSIRAAICVPPIGLVDMSGRDDGRQRRARELHRGRARRGARGEQRRIRFSCGAAPHTIIVTSEKTIEDDLVIDGGGRVTLSGGGTTRILALRPPWGTTPWPTLTLQHLTLRAGYTGNLPGSDIDNGGAAVFQETGGNLRVRRLRLRDNVGPATGQDVAGGAIYSFGSGTTTIVRSRFTGNRCSSGGAIGALGVSEHQLLVHNSLIDGNAATGSGGNPGNGGNGGGIYMDGTTSGHALRHDDLRQRRQRARRRHVPRLEQRRRPDDDRPHARCSEREPGRPDSQAGGLYLQGLQLTDRRLDRRRNAASSAGGIFVWTNPGSQTLQHDQLDRRRTTRARPRSAPAWRSRAASPARSATSPSPATTTTARPRSRARSPAATASSLNEQPRRRQQQGVHLGEHELQRDPRRRARPSSGRSRTPAARTSSPAPPRRPS